MVLEIMGAVAAVTAAVAAAVALVPSYRTSRASLWAESAEDFRGARKWLSEHYRDLVQRALKAYEGGVTGALDRDIPLLVKDGWLLPEPLPLASVTTSFVRRASGTSAEFLRIARRELPVSQQSGRPFETYSASIEALSKPRLWRNLVTYRPIAIHAGEGALRMEFVAGRYFDQIDHGDVLAYADARRMRRESGGGNSRVTHSELRKFFGDPFDFVARPCGSGISVLSVFKAKDGTRFIMHQRGGVDQVGSACGQFHVVPAGEFQPASQMPADLASECDLRKTIVREMAEELGGTEDAALRGGRQIDYATEEPYRSLYRRFDDGSVRLYLLGIGLDPLTLKLEMLAVAVFSKGEFERCFPKRLVANDEGDLSSKGDRWGEPFNEASVLAYRNDRNTLPAGVACLVLAWRHRLHLDI